MDITEYGPHDAQCLFEAALEKLRIEFNITSSKRIVAAQARALIDSYWGKGSKAGERALANWYSNR
jgi:hypothetical protein